MMQSFNIISAHMLNRGRAPDQLVTVMTDMVQRGIDRLHQGQNSAECDQKSSSYDADSRGHDHFA
jgi:hypothetical protein